MFTEEQYELAREGVNDPDPEITEAMRGKWRQGIAEYEEARSVVAAPSTASPALAEPAPEEPAAPAPEAEAAPAPAPAPEEAPAPVYHPPPAAPELDPYGYGYGPPEDPERDSKIANASKLVRLKVPTEHVSKSRVRPLAVIAKNMALDPITGPSSTMYFEPTTEQFETVMAPYLASKGIEKGSSDYQEAYELFQDRKWKEAYQKAVAEDMPLTRVAFTQQDDKWDKVSNFLGKSADTAAAFVEGVGRGYAGPARGIGLSIRDKVTGRDDVGAMRERDERHPYVGAGGAFVGSLLPGSLFGQVAGKVNALRAPVGTMGKLGMAGLAGAVGSDVELLANTAGTAVEDLIAGRPADMEAIERLPQSLGVTSALGFGGGMAGELIAKGAGALRKYFRTPPSPLYPSLPNAEATGSATSLISGVTPSKQVRDILEKARGPVPGEARGPIMEDAVGHAAAPVIEPIVNQQHALHELAKGQFAAEKQRYVSFDPVLKNQKIEPTNVLDAIFDELVTRSKPSASGQTFPRPGEEVGAWNTNKKLFDTYAGLVEPEVHLYTQLPPAALRAGAKTISVAQARELGFDIKPPKMRQPPLPIRSAPSAPPPPLGATPVTLDTLPDASLDTLPDASLDTLPGANPKDWASGAMEPPVADRIPTQPSAMTPVPASDSPVTPVPTSDSPDTLSIPDYHPEGSYVVVLKPIPMDPIKFESVIDSLDQAGNASNPKGAREEIWDKLIAIGRKDRDKFKNGEWSRMYNRHAELLNEIKQRGKYAGIVQDATYAKMTPANREAAEGAIKGYPEGTGETNKALAHLADVAGRTSAHQATEIPGRGGAAQDVRHDLEGVRAARAYLDIKSKTSLGSALTHGAGPFGLGGLLPAGKVRLDAIARGLARDTQGRPLYVPPYNPEAAMGSLPSSGRALLPSAGLFGVGGGKLGVMAGAPAASLRNDERARSTGSLDAEQMRIIDEALIRQK